MFGIQPEKYERHWGTGRGNIFKICKMKDQCEEAYIQDVVRKWIQDLQGRTHAQDLQVSKYSGSAGERGNTFKVCK